MNFKFYICYFVVFFVASCNEKISDNKKSEIITPKKIIELPVKNKQVTEIVKKYGPEISSTYKKAVCTELVIKVLEKTTSLEEIDKKRIRIITNENIQELLKNNSEIPKGVYYALTEKGIGLPIKDKNEVLEGDFVQFWTETWGHCGIVKSIDVKNNKMELYSSFPSTNGYGIQKFNIPKHTFFVRLK